MYTAHVTRDGRWWMITVDGIEGLTQARHLNEAELMAREFIAVSLDKPLDSIDVTVEVEAVNGVEIGTTVREIAEKRSQAKQLEQEASDQAIAVARALVEQRVPLRDIGTALGISYQRVHQLVS